VIFCVGGPAGAVVGEDEVDEALLIPCGACCVQ